MEVAQHCRGEDFCCNVCDHVATGPSLVNVSRIEKSCWGVPTRDCKSKVKSEESHRVGIKMGCASWEGGDIRRRQKGLKKIHPSASRR